MPIIEQLKNVKLSWWRAEGAPWTMGSISTPWFCLAFALQPPMPALSSLWDGYLSLRAAANKARHETLG